MIKTYLLCLISLIFSANLYAYSIETQLNSIYNNDSLSLSSYTALVLDSTFKIANNATPTSAKTASHIVAKPPKSAVIKK